MHLDRYAWPGVVIPAPVGDRFLVRESGPGDGRGPNSARYAVVSRDDLFRGNTAAARWVNPGPTALLSGWSPDGRSVLFVLYEAQPMTAPPRAFAPRSAAATDTAAPRHVVLTPRRAKLAGLRVLDVASGRFTDLAPHTGGPYPLARAFWDPSGKVVWYPRLVPDRRVYRLTGFALDGTVTDPAVEYPAPTNGPYLDGSGRSTDAYLDARSDVLPAGWPAQNLSPDGRYLICAPAGPWVCDLRTGERHLAVAGSHRGGLVLGWRDRDHLLISYLRPEHTTVAVVDIDGHVVREVAVPNDISPTMLGVYLTSAAAYPPGVGIRF